MRKAPPSSGRSRIQHRSPNSLYIIFSSAVLLFLQGCLSLDPSPLRSQAFFHRAERVLQEIPPLDESSPVPGELRAGAAKTDITPPVGFPMAGFGARTSTGVLDPIMARAIALSDGAETVVILELDLLAMTDDLSDAVYRKVRTEIPLRRENILIAATHTHSGPGALGRRFWESLAAGPFNEGLFEWTADRAASAVLTAYRSLRPAVMISGRTDAGDLVLNRMIPGGPTDPALGFLAFRTAQGRPLAYLVNFSAHPTVLRSRNRLLSGDFPGSLSRALEEEDGVVALYTSGALADQRARPPAGKDVYERTERMGRDLAERILNAQAGRPEQKSVRIAAREAVLELPPPQIKVGVKRRLPVWIGRSLLDSRTRFQVIRIGPSAILGVPCDLASEIGLSLKTYAAARSLEALVVGFANDYVGYVIPEKYYALGYYESFMSFNGPTMEEYLSLIMETLIDRVASQTMEAGG